MPIDARITQEPEPGKRLLRFRGDQIRFCLDVASDDEKISGTAYVRTNLGQAQISRREIIRQVELNEERLGRDWFDIPMQETAAGRFETSIGLTEVGHFEAKCLFLPQGCSEPLWPAGANTAINVEPADTVCGNIIYNAFVRQFGPHKTSRSADLTAAAGAVQVLDHAGYTVIPPSGTFRDLIAELDFIMNRLGCRLLQLLPIHPTPTTYARMGRYGSPYAALSFTAVDPALAVFDPAATPLEQFLELVDAVHSHGGKLIIDIAINHTGWAASLHETHPQWLARNQAGEIENPGAWGVVWADLTRLDYRHKDMWTYMADVFLTWCRRGVDGFRCDAGYMIPAQAWQYIIAKVRDQYPDTLFLLEGLGGKISVTRDLLNRANFNWAYSELFQNYDRGQIEAYLPEALELAATNGLTVHFAETHDNDRLAATSHSYASMRTALCALLSPCGTFGFANGVEWFATQKINVHEASGLNWGAAENQVDAIARLSRLLKTHPAFGPGVDPQLISRGDGNFIVLARHWPTAERVRTVLVAANLDADRPVTAGWPNDPIYLNTAPIRDLLTGNGVTVQAEDDRRTVDLVPGQVLCLADAGDLWPADIESQSVHPPLAVIRQRLKAKVLEAMTVYGLTTPSNMDAMTDKLKTDPVGFCRQLNPHSAEPRVVQWSYPVDLKRQVMVPPGHFILLHADHSFRARIVDQGRTAATEQSLMAGSGRAFILFCPLDTPDRANLCDLEITCHTPEGSKHHQSQLLFLAPGRQARVQMIYSRNDCHRLPLMVLGTNGRGAMLRVHADFRHLASRYDGLLAANLNPDYPEDRRIMLSRCRAWIVFQGYSQEVNLDCLEQFGFDYRIGGRWRYCIPTGQGEHIILLVAIAMLPDPPNTVVLKFERPPSAAGQTELANEQPVTLIVRPDIEDRNFHHCTKAFQGPEEHWPASVVPMDKGFGFAPSPGYQFNMAIDTGRFVLEPEWYYSVHRSLEAQRGLDPDSDLFGPGYFSSPMLGRQQVTITARAITGKTSPTDTETQNHSPKPSESFMPKDSMPLEAALSEALGQYVVRRDAFNTVVAGFPWFLDWGRDTLIVVRGLVAAGKLDTAKAILVQFARYAQEGTLPNMIRGNDASNRDTSDAPLWLFIGCADLIQAEGHDEFLTADCEGSTLGQTLIDMAKAVTAGTPNGVCMDRDSGLLFSPAHFTWMDTNYPAATPRQGYPIEIQALWFAALVFLTKIDTLASRRWASLAQTVKASIQALFWDTQLGYLVDCRHAEPGQTAAQARPDDALRPNQLLAITLGAIDDPGISARILSACQTLLVPGAIRSLADQTVKMPLAVFHNGHLLNNPDAPYWGRYTGDEDTCRKPAYHNGTAWTWLFPSFCEAWVDCYGPPGRQAALAWLSSSTRLIDSHCVGHIPEIVDGNAPHLQRGCDAQAWGVSELLRVWKKLTAST